MEANYNKNGVDLKEIEKFLHDVDSNFLVPLSQKQNLGLLAVKLCEKGTICTIYEDGIIVAMVAGYTRDTIENMGYISIVATLEKYQGKGYASGLVKEFIRKSKEQGLCSVHLYTDKKNVKAIDMYKKIGFTEWRMSGELRPDDVHLIFNVEI